jgi:hypothetical protein
MLEEQANTQSLTRKGKASCPKTIKAEAQPDPHRLSVTK